jgi:hypothetical protein
MRARRTLIVCAMVNFNSMRWVNKPTYQQVMSFGR